MPKKKNTSSPEEDRKRFIAAAHELGCDESSDDFEAKLKKLATVKPMSNSDLKKRKKK